MTGDRYVDGNAFASALTELFGREMSDAMSCCGGCATTARLGELHVYDQGPGDVVRCPSCETVQLVAIERPTGLRFYFGALRWVQSAQPPSSSS